jgi:hypothetical protein
MKKLLLLSLAGFLTASSFAHGKDKTMVNKMRNAVKIEKACPEGWPKTGCSKM